MPTISQILNAQALTFSTGLNKILNDVSLSAKLDDLTDTTITTPTPNQILTYNGNYWINTNPVQPFTLNNDLISISNITTNNGLLRKNSTGSWSLDLNQYLSNINITGDVTGVSVLNTNTSMVGQASIDLTLANSGVIAGTYNNEAHISQFTVDAKGRITNVGNPIIITPDWSSVKNNPFVINNPVTDQTLCYNGTNWVNKTIPAIKWSEISNNPILVTNPTINQVLTYDGVNWVNSTPSPTFSLDADLIAIGNITNTNGLLRKIAADTWVLDTNSYLTSVTLVGDVSGVITGNNATLTLANSGVIAGTYNNEAHISQFTVDAKGRITNVGNPIIITPDWSSVKNNPISVTNPVINQVLTYDGVNWVNKTLTTIKWSEITNNPILVTNPTINQVLTYDGVNWVNSTPSPTFSLDADLIAIGNITNTNGLLRKIAADTWVLDTNSYLTSVTLVGDVSGVITGNNATLTLANSGVIAGTYNNEAHISQFTVDAKGRITNVGNPIIITPDWSSVKNNPISVTNPVINQVLTYDGVNWVNKTLTTTSTGNTTAYEVVCVDWAAGNFTLPTGWVATKVNSDTALQIKHNLHKTPISWSGINTLSVPNLSIVPSSTRNMQIDSIDQSTFLQVGSLGSFKLFLLFL